jgi:hypothetical protein
MQGLLAKTDVRNSRQQFKEKKIQQQSTKQTIPITIGTRPYSTLPELTKTIGIN